jgi:hypothetical protein
MREVIMKLLLGTLMLPAAAAAAQWTSHSKDFGDSRSDFIMREVERRPRSSVVHVEVKNIGASVGSSMILSCMLARLAEERGGYRYVYKKDSTTANGYQMLVGFSRAPTTKPQQIDAELPSTAPEIDLDIFGPEFNKNCRAKKP